MAEDLYELVMDAARSCAVVDETLSGNERVDDKSMREHDTPLNYAFLGVVKLVPTEGAFPSDADNVRDYNALESIEGKLRERGLEPVPESKRFFEGMPASEARLLSLTYEREMPGSRALLTHDAENIIHIVSNVPLKEVVVVGYHIPEKRFWFRR